VRLDPLAGFAPGSAWLCRNSETQAQAWMLAGQNDDPSDSVGWDRLCSMASPFLQRPVAAFLVKAKRWELFECPQGASLASEIPNIGRAVPALIIAVLEKLAKAVDCLHKAGLVHCHLNPQNVFVLRQGEGWSLVITGLDGVIALGHGEPVQLPVDPFYSPPEAANAAKQPPEAPLKAWDWWCVGRIVQELVLGRHVLEYLLDHTLSRTAAEDQVCAEELLHEKFNTETKAGAVESMPPIDKRIDLLLRGLLTSCRDARWGGEEVFAWLAGGEPKERYQLPRTERLFTYKSKSYTIPEAAQVLSSAENWDDAQKQIFDKKSPFTLATFLVEQADLRTYAAKLDDALALSLSIDLRNFPPPVKTEVILAMALLRLGGEALIWRGRRMDAACLRDMLSDIKAVPNRLSCVQAFCTTSVLLPLEKLDPEAFRTLSDGAKLAAKAVNRATKADWLVVGGAQAIPSIWRLSWESPAVLQEARKQLLDGYAFSDRKDVQELLDRETLQPEESLILAWMVPYAERLGFVTREVWEQRQRSLLAARATTLANGLFWVGMERTLIIGLPWFGNLIVVGALSLLTSLLIALAWPGPEYIAAAVIPLILALGVRIAVAWLLANMIKQAYPKVRWGVFDGASRCAREFATLLPEKPSTGKIKKELVDINEHLVKYSRNADKTAQIFEPGHFQELRMLGVLSWFFVLVPGFFAINELRTTKAPLARLEYAWTPENERDLEWLPPEPEVKIDFAFEQPKSPRHIPVLDTEPASRAQVKVAIRRGIYLAGNYRPEDINACILVKMPHTRDHAFMIYDPKSRKLVTDDILFLPLTPNRHTWAVIDNKVVFLPDY
jgi:hypothetical protein